MQKVSGHFIAPNAAAVNLNLGFVPSYFKAYSALGGTELLWEWYKILAELETTGQYGIVDDGAGAKSMCADADNGIIAYDTESPAVELPAPSGTGYTKVISSNGSYDKTKCTVFTDGGAQPTARSTSVVGTVVWPSTRNGCVYECTVSAGVLGTEPTWPTKPGNTISDGTNTWICREERICTIGAKGVTLGASIMTDNQIWVYEAELHEDVVSKGDAQGVDPL